MSMKILINYQHSYGSERNMHVFFYSIQCDVIFYTCIASAIPSSNCYKNRAVSIVNYEIVIKFCFLLFSHSCIVREETFRFNALAIIKSVNKLLLTKFDVISERISSNEL